MRRFAGPVAGVLAVAAFAFFSCAGSGDPGQGPGQKVAAAPAPPPPAAGQPAAPTIGGVSLADGFAPVVARVGPAVVNISTEKLVKGGPVTFEDPFFGPFGGNPFEGPFGGGAPDRREKSLGSGVIVSADGYILTNNHVVSDASEIRVSLADRRDFVAKVIGADAKTDIALIKIEAKGLPTIPLGDSTALRVGEFVLAIGNPFGLDHSVTLGIVSAVGRGSMGITDYEDFIQTDAAINPGNSGGALVNSHGELVGINTAILSRTQGNHGVGFAVPTHQARAVMDQLRKSGRVVRGYLGVSIQEITPRIAGALGLDRTDGALIGDVVPGQAAARAGVQRGDVVVTLDGKPVASSQELRLRISQTAPGTKVKLGVLRGGARKELVATLAELPEDQRVAALGRRATPGKGAPHRDLLGIEVVPLDPRIVRQLDLPPGTQGVVVAQVAPGSRAEEAGLRRYDVIVEAGKKPVNDAEDLEQIVKAAGDKPVLLLVRRGQATVYVVL